ncbi:MAG: hypothetical protein C0402_16425 [Thermodesulfovibrio sp.]|nr:hypothetical protein [Thermodesulfovibrio sp.]
MIRLAAVLLAAVWFMTAVPGYADGGGLVEVEIVSDRGEVMQAIPHKSFEAGRTWVVKKYLEAMKNRNYRIMIRNNSSGRIGVVAAVDGRNIISGRKSHLRSDEEMYIINAYGSITLDGWRTDERTTHQFYFAEQADSYSKKTFGDTSAMGVIAVAAFNEKERYGYLYERSLQKAPAPGVSGAMTGKDAVAGASVQAPAHGSAKQSARKSEREAGTGFGEEQYSPSIRVAFEPEPLPVTRTLIKYEWRETLCRKGVLRCAPPEHNRLWDEGRYAPFPPGYSYRR